MNPKASLIIDNNNVKHQGRSVDYLRLLEVVERHVEVSEGFVFLYNNSEQPLIDFIRFRMKWVAEVGREGQATRPCSACGGTSTFRVEKCTDVAVAVRMLKQAMARPGRDIVLASGDIDYLPAVHAVQDWGCTVHVAALTPSASPRLLSAIDGMFIPLDELVTGEKTQ